MYVLKSNTNQNGHSGLSLTYRALEATIQSTFWRISNFSNSLFADNIGKRYGGAVAPRNLGSPYRDCRLRAKPKNPKSSV